LKAFEIFDADNKGFISKQDFLMLTGFSKQYSKYLYSTIDLNCNGKIEFDELA